MPTLNRRNFIKITSSAITAAMLPGCAPSRRKPNVVFILVDDVGCYGSEFYERPNIDSLDVQEMRFAGTNASYLPDIPEYPDKLAESMDWQIKKLLYFK